MTRGCICLLLSLLTISARAQQVDSLYVNLYTDSLKKGMYNYINLDGRLRNGRYLPLDSTHLLFSASAGHFVGNCLLLDKNTTAEKVTIKAVLRSNPALFREFTLWIKTRDEGERLKTTEELLRGMQPRKHKRKGR
jgi:hypothetical protein